MASANLPPTSSVPIPWNSEAPSAQQTQLVTYLRPGWPAVEALVEEAKSLLERYTRDGSFDGYVSGKRSRVHQQVRAVYEALRARQPTYRVEPWDSVRTRQVIRTAEAVLAKLHGCCIDLVLVMASALLDAGLSPIILVVQDWNGARHAVLGFWTTENGGVYRRRNQPVPVLGWPDLERYSTSGLLKVVECTDVAGDASHPKGHPYGQALLRGGTHLPRVPSKVYPPAYKPDDRNRLLYAVDVKACQKLGIVPPQPPPPSPPSPAPPPEPTRRRFPIPRWWEDHQALHRYRQHLKEQFRFFSFLSRADPLELDRIYLELNVHRFVPPQEASDGATRKPKAADERTGSMQAVEALLLPPPRFLVAGDPGSGKTTLGRHLVFCLASRAPALRELARTWAPNRVAKGVRRLGWRWLADSWTRFPLPLFLPLSRVGDSPEAVQERLVQLLEPGGFADPQGYLERRLRTGDCAIFLDALDEIMEETTRVDVARAVNRFAEQFPGNLIVVTCRVAGLSRRSDVTQAPAAGNATTPGLETEFKMFRRLQLQELSPKQVDPFVRNWFAGSGRDPDALLQALRENDRLRLLTPNPLLLALICLVYERDVRLPERRVDLYQRSAELLLAGLYVDKKLPSPPFDLATQQRALGAIAVGLHQAGVRQAGRSLLSRRLRSAFPGWPEVRRDALLDWLVGRGELIQRESRDTYAFGHFTFQEFFVAWHFQAKRSLRTLLARSSDPWWREVLLLLAGLLPDATRLLEELRNGDRPEIAAARTSDSALAGMRRSHTSRLCMAAAALAEARGVASESFVRAGQGIVRDLQNIHQHGGAPGLQAAEALARVPGWGTRDYLLAQAETEGGHPALTAFLVLLTTLDPEDRRTRWPKLGPLLQRLHRGLGIGGSETDQAILTALDRLGFPLVHVPSGEFLMGSDDGPTDERPRHTLRLTNYWIGKYPVTNSQFAAFVAETQHRGEGDWRRRFTDGKDQHPVVDVSCQDALAFCQWAGAKLPSEAEWEKAARGTDGRKYPWGNEWDAVRCNTSESGLRSISPVGDYPNGTSPYGCHDMAGNVWEWTRSVLRPYPYDSADGRETLKASGNRVLRGGSWFGDREFARCACRFGSDPANRCGNDGFRVVASPF